MFRMNLKFGIRCFKSSIKYSRSLSTGTKLFRHLHETENVEAFTSKYYKHKEIIDNIIKENPKFNERISVCDIFIDQLEAYGFNHRDSLQIIKKDPDVLEISGLQLKNNLARWCGKPIGSEFGKFLILNNPSFLYLPLIIIERRLPLLEEIAKKPKDLVLLLLRCPNVLTEQWEQIQSKVDYLKNVMRVENAEILQSEALNKSLSHIQVRHSILLKCGLYDTPSQYEHKKVKSKKSTFQNPHLKRIVDNEDVSFSRKICKISHEEYNCYRDLFELDEFRDEEHFSGSDSDSE